MCDNIFSLRIKDLRTANNLTQLEFGKIFGLSKQTINDIEHSRTTTTASKIIDIAKYFNVTSDYLLGLSDNKNSIYNINSLDSNAKELLTIYSTLNDFSKGILIENARIFMEKQSRKVK